MTGPARPAPPPPAVKAAARRLRQVRSRLESWDEARRRTCWPVAQPFRGPAAPSVAAVVVNYDTAQLTAQLVFTLMRVLEPGVLSGIVVVDGSPEPDATGVLQGLHDAGIVTLLRNTSRPYHGPGLNRGLSHLARRHADGHPVDLVWVLDSDVLVLRPEALRTTVAAMAAAGAVLAGQVRSPYPLRWPAAHVTPGTADPSSIWQPHWVPEQAPSGGADGPHPRFWPYVHVSSLLLDPAVVWQPALPPFQEDGEPGIAMQVALHAQGHRVVDVPLFRDEHLLHLGRGTSFAVRDARRRRNRYYRWSRNETSHHFEGNVSGASRYEAFWKTFVEQAPVADPQVVVEACLRAPRLAFA